MAKRNGCPGCHSLYNGHTSIGIAEQEGSGEQRGESSSKSAAQTSPTTIYNPFYTGRPRTPAGAGKHIPIDRQEIIRRIKSGGSRPTSPELERPASRSSLKKLKSPTTPEQPPPQPSEQPLKQPDAPPDNQTIGLEIERPRSALHRGDFREKSETPSAFERFGETEKEEAASSLSTSPPAPWHPGFPSAALRRYQPGPTTPYQRPEIQPARSRAVSTASLASTFVYKPPTSPLVQASRPDTPEPPARRASRSPDKSRRRTFSPEYLQRFGSALDYPTSARHYGHITQPPTLRSERTYPYQAHQPRRSLNSFASLPQTPSSRSRRPSLSESPLQHATMVGSYEESILRGRMSTTPSKPLNFVAQIGVLGKGDCKANLRCPPHATVPFPAVFYSYGSGTSRAGSTITTDQPSPYVGLVDLENSLPPAAGTNRSTERRRQRQHSTTNTALGSDSAGSRASSLTRGGGGETSTSEAQARRRIRQKQKRRSGSPKAPPGGCYRIPQQGQLQIVIKNPNKTAVKLFLVPYDLSDMEAGQKTFIRQRSYSAGPILDLPLSSSSSSSSGVGAGYAAGGGGSEERGEQERPTLRYLVHLHICCPAKGRYFLYKSIRVVFANRVPDGKEKLRNEIQLPEPKYSTYKPGRDSNAGLGGVAQGNAAAAAAAATPTPKEGARRRSALETPLPSSLVDDSPAVAPPPGFPPFLAQSLPVPGGEFASSTTALSSAARMPMPIHPPPFPRPPALSTPFESRAAINGEHVSNGMPAQHEPTNEMTTPGPRSKHTAPAFVNGDGVRKLDEPFHFESREQMPGTGKSESLLSRRLKEFALQAQRTEEEM